MSLIDALDFLGRQYAPAFPPPAEVSDAEADRWHDDGAGMLMDALAAVGLRRAWRAGEATAKDARRVVANLVIDGRTALRGFTQSLVEKASTLAVWYRSMKGAAMPRLYAGVMALIGTVDLPPVDRKATKAAAAVQVGLLDNFRRQVAEGRQKLDGSAVGRAGLYAGPTWTVAANIHREAMARSGYEEERRILAPDAQHCVTCPEEAAKGWVPIGTLRAIGDSECHQSCRCFYQYR